MDRFAKFTASSTLPGSSLHLRGGSGLRHLLATLGCVLASLTIVALSESAAFAQAPIVERVEPPSGSPGTSVVLVGRNFPPDVQVELGGVALQVTQRLPNRVTVVIAPTARSGILMLRSGGMTFRGPTFRVADAPQAPQIDSFTPAAGPPGTEVTITGRNFSPRVTENSVLLGNVTVPIRAASPFSLRVTIPPGAPSGPFLVRVNGVETRSAGGFQVLAGVSISDFQPRAGGPGTRVTITGSGFSPRLPFNRVSLNGSIIRIEAASATQLLVVIPPTATTGPFTVDVRGAGQTVSSFPFTVTAPAPVVTGLAPDRGRPGMRVRIVGEGFGTDPNAIRVMLGAVPVPVRAVSPRMLVVEIPPNAGSGSFAVTVGTQTVASPVFTVMVGVAVTDFQPRTGPVGTEVRILGTGFDPTPTRNVVLIGRTPQLVLAASPTELRVRIGGTQSGPLRVSVSNSGTALTPAPFVITTPPQIVRFDPVRGLAGSEVTLFGSGFGDRLSLVSVTLGGRPVAVRSVANDRIGVTIPPNAVTGRFRVTVQLQGVVESSSDFEVLAPLVVTAVRPAQAPVGAEISLVGSGFDPEPRNVMLLFTGGRRAPARASSPQEIRVRVPAGAQSGPITVVLRDTRTTTSGFFEVIAPPRITRIEPLQGSPGTRVTITGSGFAARTAQGSVRIGNQEMAVESLTDTQIVATIPMTARTGRISLTIANLPVAIGPRFTVTAAVIVTPVAPPGGLTVTAITPECTRPGCRVTFTGAGFHRELRFNRVLFGATPCRVVGLTPTTLVIELPPTPGTAQFTIEVRRAARFVVPPPFTITP